MEIQGSAFAAAAVASTERAAPFARRSYMPSWMADPTWVRSIELPPEYMAELVADGRSSVATTRRSSSAAAAAPALVATSRRTMASWASVDTGAGEGSEAPQQHLMSLLSHAIKSVTQRTPWDPEDYGVEARKVMLAVLLKKFLDQSLDPGAVGLFAKDVLRRASDTDVARELQYVYVAFTYDRTWNGSDPYRRPENFMRRQDYEAFQQHCLDEVERRLHMLNIDVNGKGRNIAHAVSVWQNIHGAHRGECFGGSITLSLMSVRLRVVNGGSSGTASDRKWKPPKQVKAVWSLRLGGRAVCSAAVTQKCVLRNGEYEWPNNSRVTLMVPKGASDYFKDYTVSLELMVSKSTCLCAAPREKTIACASITVDDALYASVAHPDSALRSSDSHPQNGKNKEPFAHTGEVATGYHFSLVLLSTGSTAEMGGYPCAVESARVWCSMHCLHEAHNTRPPAIDVVEQVAAGGEAVTDAAAAATNLSAWSEDHHGNFLRLVDILGDVDDVGVMINKAYCRRYLIHGELETVALLSAVCTHSNLADRASRELCAHAVASMRDLAGSLTTRVGEQLVADALATTRAHALDVALSLEDVAAQTREAAAAALAGVKALLRAVEEGVDVDVAIEQAAKRDAMPLEEALQRLDGRVLREHRREVVRATATDLTLPDLEQHEDCARLTGKTRYLLELVTRVMERCTRAYTFANASESAPVQAVALCRIASIAHVMCAPLRNVVTRILACLVRAPEPDPLGDTLGLLVSTYGAVMRLVDVLDEDPAAAALCVEWASCFADFLSCWFPLCEGHIATWMASIVSNEALEPILCGTVHFNQSPALLLDLLQSLLAVFIRLLVWCDPHQHIMYAVHFFNLVQNMGEAFVDAIVAQGRAASRLEEWLVCLSNLRRYQYVVRNFGDTVVKTRLIDALGDPECVMEHQRKVVAEQTRASTLETEEELVRHVQQALEQSMLSFLSGLSDISRKKQDTSPAEMRHTADRLAEYVRQQLMLANSNLEDGLFAAFLGEIAVRAYYGAFSRFLLRGGAETLSQSRVALLLNLLQSLDAELESVGGDIVQTEMFTSRQRNGCLLIVLMGQSSPSLVQMANTAELDGAERKQVGLVLRSRTDSVAKQYVRATHD
ncbi:hypothetical protein DQ04_05351010 [Trypanosoma grayi]|uniref:hypothetical protein n=1 Tax=Trypanosoma grayi TaxID=71804 RepID=UPI0004F46F72|nr:hypothetical protein DQ04_05351010 [Trypanosoma grayi]KEG09360.1 hypothetical protein DQ04_05351010 [Trypanosoma grayi]